MQSNQPRSDAQADDMDEHPYPFAASPDEAPVSHVDVEYQAIVDNVLVRQERRKKSICTYARVKTIKKKATAFSGHGQLAQPVARPRSGRHRVSRWWRRQTTGSTGNPDVAENDDRSRRACCLCPFSAMLDLLSGNDCDGERHLLGRPKMLGAEVDHVVQNTHVARPKPRKPPVKRG